MESETETHRRVRIHIDRVPHESHNPTTGDDLYALGHVHSHHHLYRQVQGDHEDQLVPRGNEKVHLTQDEHFYSAEDHKKGITIVVNTRDEKVYRHRLSYEQVVKLAYPKPPAPDVVGYRVTYFKGHEHNHKGELRPGQSVRICEGMVFDVTPTNRS